MLKLKWILCLLFVLPLVARPGDFPPEGWTQEKWFSAPRSNRVSNYWIRGVLDWPAKRLQGSLSLRWRNDGRAGTDQLPLHLYMNAFKGPDSLFMAGGGLKEIQDAKRFRWGSCELKSVKLEGKALDGRYGQDETVYWVQLPRVIKPGETIDLAVRWETQFPQLHTRAGYSKDFLMMAQWFPKVGVYQDNTWNCHPYYYLTEFFSDFGNYDVELSLPKALIPAVTGTVVSQTGSRGEALDARQDPDRKLNAIYKIHAEDVHDFALAIMPRLSWKFRLYPFRGVQLYFFYQSSNLDQLPRQFEAVKAALKMSNELLYPYPYPTLTIVDIPLHARQADGMEYPTLITASSTPFDPLKNRDRVEGVAIHEIGHQYFQGMLASNEVEDVWLDEGFASWFTLRTLQDEYQTLLGTRRFYVGPDFSDWNGYWRAPQVDPITRKGHEMKNLASYLVAGYHKPVLMFQQLEALLGRPTLDRIMGVYAREMAFKHPKAEDFKRIAEREAGRSLEAFWKQFLDGTDVLDYIIEKVAFEGGKGRIELKRRGAIQVPITLWVRLEDGTEQRLYWDGRLEKQVYEFDRKVMGAILDPDGNHPMLKDRLRASYTDKVTRRGLHYWSQLLWGSVTALLQGVGIG